VFFLEIRTLLTGSNSADVFPLAFQLFFLEDEEQRRRPISLHRCPLILPLRINVVLHRILQVLTSLTTRRPPLRSEILKVNGSISEPFKVNPPFLRCAGVLPPSLMPGFVRRRISCLPKILNYSCLWTIEIGASPSYAIEPTSGRCTLD